MNFELSEEQIVLQKSVRDFCERMIVPNARRWDQEEIFPHEVIPAMGEMGLLGMQIPEEYGGAGMGISTTSSRSKRSRAPMHVRRPDGGVAQLAVHGAPVSRGHGNGAVPAASSPPGRRRSAAGASPSRARARTRAPRARAPCPAARARTPGG